MVPVNRSASKLESDKYHVIRELGRGGMGVVYLAEDQRLKREVALKVLYEHLNRDTTFATRFQEEARAVSTLHHPNIVCIHGLEQAHGVVAIDMEYVDGKSLDQLASEAVLTPHIIVAIARDVLRGLVTCHDIGIVHRDIKPSNILVHRNGIAKITDFGLATAYASHLEGTIRGNTSSGFYMGTPRYMPVDSWEGGEPKPAWDLYALGIVLFELFSGRDAFSGDNPVAIIKKHITEPLPELQTVTKGLSKELTDLVDRLVGSTRDGETLCGAEALEIVQTTREFDELHDSNVASTVVVRRSRRRRTGSKALAFRRRVAYSGMAMIAIGLIFFLAYSQKLPSLPGTVPVVVSTELPTSNPTNFDLDGTHFATIRVIGTPAVEQVWMVTRDKSLNTLEINGLSSRGLTRLIGEIQQNGDWKLTGGWAECVLPQAGSIQFGDVTGTLHWADGRGDLHARLDFIKENDHEPKSLSVVGTPARDITSRQAFLEYFESASLLQTMLYTELLPRNLTWATEMEALLPAQAGTRHLIPYDRRAVEIDGKLTESVWTEGHFRAGQGRIGDLQPVRPRAGTTLHVRWNHDAIHIASQIELDDHDIQFELAILPAFEISLPNSGRFTMEIGESNTAAFAYFLGQVEQKTTLQFPVSMNHQDGVCTVELTLPQEILKETARAQSNKRWRVNAQWFRVTETGTRDVLARWGGDVLRDLEHGALFQFEEDAAGVPGT